MGLTKKLSTNYFKSKDIRVFPSSFRGTYTPSNSGEKVFDPESRLNTEANFIAPGRVGNNISYIVSHTTSNIKFVVGGYYFELNNLSDYTNFLKGAELGIKLREITIADSTEDPSRKTLILDSWEEGTTNILDSTGIDDNNISFFLGLKKIVTGDTATASIKLFNTDGTINQEAFLVELKHGTGTNSLMHGTGLIAGGSNQTVIGTYNNNVIDSDTNEAKNIFEIGVGTATDTSSRKNAVEVSKTGNTTLNGTLTANGATQLNNTLTVGTSNNNKATDLHGSLTVDGTTQLNNTLTVGTTDNNKKTTLCGELEATGTSTLATTATIDNTGITIGSSGEGNTRTTTLNGTLTTNGTTTLNDNLTVATDKTTTLGGELIVGTTNTAAANKKATINGSLTVADNTILGGDSTTNIVNIKKSPGENEVNVKITGTTQITSTTSIHGSVGIVSTTGSSSKTTGALIVGGGAGIGQNLNVGGDTNLNNKLVVKTSPTSSETNVKVDGTLNITGKANIYNNVTVDSDKTTLAKSVEITDTTSSTDSSTGALKISGGVGVAENVNIGGTLTTTSTTTSGGKLTVSTDGADITGNVEIKSGTLKSAKKLTVESEGAEIAGNLNITSGGATITGTTALKGNTTVGESTTAANLKVYGEVESTSKIKAASAEINGNTEIKSGQLIVGTNTIIDSDGFTLATSGTGKQLIGNNSGSLSWGGNLAIDGNTTLAGNLLVGGSISTSAHNIILSDTSTFIWAGTAELNGGKNEIDLTSHGSNGIPNSMKIISVQVTVNSTETPPNEETYDMLIIAANWIHHDFYFPLTVYADIDSKTPTKINLYANRKCKVYLTAYCIKA